MKKFWLLTIITLLACFNSFGQSQDCYDLLRKYDAMTKEKKQTAAEEIRKQIEAKDCKDKRVLEYMYHASSIQKRPTKTSEFKLSEDTVSIGYQGSEHFVAVSGGGSWKAEVDNDWCMIEKQSGGIVIRCLENPSIHERIGVIIVTSGYKSRRLVVKNGGAPEYLRSSFKTLSFPSEGDIIEVDISSNTKWKVDSIPSWISVKRNDNLLVFSAKPNTLTQKREGLAVISSPASTVVIGIDQVGVDEHLTFSKNDITFGPNGGDEYIKVYTNVEAWIFDNLPWCHVTRIDKDLIKISCNPNEPTDQVRKCYVKVRGFESLGINVTQEANPIVYRVIPDFGIGGKALSFGISAGYVYPFISSSSGGNFTGSVVNYALGNDAEDASFSVSGGFNIGVFADIRLYKNYYLKTGIEYTYYSYKNTFDSNVERLIRNASTLYYIRGVAKNNYEENYTTNQLDMPILASYRISTGTISHVQLNVGPVFHYGLSSKLNLSGNTDIDNPMVYKYENLHYTNQPYPGLVANPIHYALNGELDMFEKSGSYTKTYTVGNNSDEHIDCSLDDAPIKRFGFGIRIGAAYEYAGISVGIEYNQMLSNMANKRFWDGNRWIVFDGETSNLVMSGYKQRNNYLCVKLSYTFRY